MPLRTRRVPGTLRPCSAARPSPSLEGRGVRGVRTLSEVEASRDHARPPENPPHSPSRSPDHSAARSQHGLTGDAPPSPGGETDRGPRSARPASAHEQEGEGLLGSGPEGTTQRGGIKAGQGGSADMGSPSRHAGFTVLPGTQDGAGALPRPQCAPQRREALTSHGLRGQEPMEMAFSEGRWF